MVPPAGVRRAPVHQHQAGAIPLAPNPIGDVQALDGDRTVLGESPDGPGEPGGAPGASGMCLLAACLWDAWLDQKGEARYSCICGATTSGELLVTVAQAIYWDPFDEDIDTAPYEVWRRMRDEAPLYRNDKYDFWALTRHADVHAAHSDPGDLSAPATARCWR